MRILIYPHDMGIGGSQLNAIELAAAVKRRGHEVLIFGRPGTLNVRIAELGLEFIPSPEPRHRPSPSVSGALGRLIADRGIDVVHGYEWPPALEACLATRRRGRAVAVATVMSMSVAPFIPRSMPILVGTEQILAREVPTRGAAVGLLEPPVDLSYNMAPARRDIDAFKERCGIRPGEVTCVVVSRLAAELKLEGLHTAIDAFAAVSETMPVRLVVVGDGPARATLESHAREVNPRERPVVVFTGEITDPRVAYAAANFSIGMGGSALRAMAFGLPLIVQGERGFFRLLDRASSEQFFWQGWYGIGDGVKNGLADLLPLIRELAADPGRRRELGQFGRQLVQDRYSIDRAADAQVEWYQRWSTQPPSARSSREEVSSALRWGLHQARRRLRRSLGAAQSEDFNSLSTTRQADHRHSGSRATMMAGAGSRAKRGLIYMANVDWDGIPGTDRRLAEELAKKLPVRWLNPPRSVYRAFADRTRKGWFRPRVHSVVPGLRVLRSFGPPGVTRPVMREIARITVVFRLLATVLTMRSQPAAIVGARLPPRFPWMRRIPFVHYATDDFVAGAPLMGQSDRLARREQRASLARADIVLAVSDVLARELSDGSRDVRVLANGCAPELFARDLPVARPQDAPHGDDIVGLVGQLNERLDLAILRALVESGVRLMIIGPRTDSDPAFRKGLDQFLAQPSVTWLGPKPYAELPAYLAAMKVGITPYRSSAFNAASCPLKTLEYLSAGLPVVTTMDPNVHGLNAILVSVASDAGDFVCQVQRWIDIDSDEQKVERRRFAERNSWAARADELLEAIASIPDRR